MTKNLTGTVAIVTGASSGIGEATARELAALGASVALIARRKDRLDELTEQIAADGGTALAIEADITKQRQAEAAVETAVEHFGRIDILVNNAGVMLIGPFLDAEIADFDKMIAVNQAGLLYMTKAALPYLLDAVETGERQIADIVNVSSHAGRISFPNFGVYNMTKFGVNGFTEALRQEITRRHVRVGALEPGAVDTELISHNSADTQAALDRDWAALSAKDIAEAVAFMVTRPWRASVGELWMMPTEQG